MRPVIESKTIPEMEPEVKYIIPKFFGKIPHIYKRPKPAVEPSLRKKKRLAAQPTRRKEPTPSSNQLSYLG